MVNRKEATSTFFLRWQHTMYVILCDHEPDTESKDVWDNSDKILGYALHLVHGHIGPYCQTNQPTVLTSALLADSLARRESYHIDRVSQTRKP